MRPYLGIGDRDEDGGSIGNDKEKGKYMSWRAEGVVSHHVHPSEIHSLFEKIVVEDAERKVGSKIASIIACESFLGAELAEKLNGSGEEQ